MNWHTLVPNLSISNVLGTYMLSFRHATVPDMTMSCDLVTQSSQVLNNNMSYDLGTFEQFAVGLCGFAHRHVQPSLPCKGVHTRCAFAHNHVQVSVRSVSIHNAPGTQAGFHLCF